MLAALGVGPAEEEVYRLLVARGRAALQDLAARSGRPESETRDILTALAGRGLVVRQAAEGAADVFVAAPPPSRSAGNCGVAVTS
ncbi:helix-turn-helix domain-containing protein [Streptomyces sp. NPDC001914]|uniref:helix-turn-helix domain-containing protein n=1 Tax=Streptomyces sp. NPDC001914 TaxID=3364623 RepID=UPI003696B7C3